MTRTARTQLTQPIFHEPIFGEDGSPPDPTGFSTAHPSDTALYKQIGDQIKRETNRIAKDQGFSTVFVDITAAAGGYDMTNELIKDVEGLHE